MKQTWNHLHADLRFLITILIILALFTLVLAIGIGPVQVAPRDVLQVLFEAASSLGSHTPDPNDSLAHTIVIHLRLPRVLLAMIVGASLAVSGVTMQALVKNKLADPFILGVSSGAGVTAVLGLLFGVFSFFGRYALSISAFFGAMVTVILVFSLSKIRGRLQITQLLLCGVAISMFADGLMRFLTLSAPNALGIHNATFWLSGSFASVRWGYLTLPLLVLLVCLMVLLLHHRALNLLLLGEDSAGALGVNVPHLQKLLLLIVSLMVGTSVAVSGGIGFIGLMVPHFTRLLVGSDHRKVLPVSALLGGILLVWVDAAARTILAPREMPVGVLTAIIGAPIFIFLLKRAVKHR